MENEDALIALDPTFHYMSRYWQGVPSIDSSFAPRSRYQPGGTLIARVDP